MQTRFADITNQALNALWEEDPVEATFLGIHTYDEVLPRTDPASRDAYNQQRAALLTQLKEFQQRSAELDVEQRLDLELLTSQLEVSLFTDYEFILPERRADLYPFNALYGVYLLAMRQFAPLEERLVVIRERLSDTPRYLIEGIENLRRGSNIPRVWTEIGIDVAKGGTSFYREFIPKLARQEQSLEQDILLAADKSLAALEEYSRFLTGELLERSDGDFATGEDAFNFLIQKKHHLPYSAQQIKEIGEEMVTSTLRQLESVAADLSLDETWNDLLERIKQDHPQRLKILEVYQHHMDSARQFVQDHDLVTIPDRQHLHVVETPVFERPTIPYAAYVPPAPFEETQDGFFWVTPADADDEDKLKEQLRGHNTWGIPITALHEGYPGHHLQLCRANQLTSHVRKQFSTPVFVEGWALYCEEMMEEQGFLNDPRSYLLRLKDQLWRACRVVIDVGLHCLGMSFEEAVAMLVDVAKLERPNAVSEVRRYTLTPTYQMSYMIGKREIMALREKVRSARGMLFNLKDFHDRLLSYGSIPVSMLGKLMVGE